MISMNSKRKFRTASFVFGIISIILIFFGLAVPAAALGIMFALLSKDEEPLSGKATAGFVMSLTALILGIIVVAASVYLIFSGTYEEMMRTFLGNDYSVYDDFYDSNDFEKGSDENRILSENGISALYFLDPSTEEIV